MSVELIPVLALVAMFVIATVLPLNMGALGFVAAFLVGTLALGLDTDDIIAGFPGGLVLTLIGITYLFAIAQNNGTVDLLVRIAVRLVAGRVALMPWVMFGITALLTAIGALSPAAVAIVAPIALGFALRYKINPLLMGMMVIHGAQGGGFSPISIYGVTVNGITADAGLPSSPTTLFVGTFLFNLAIAGVLFVLLGGRGLIGRRVDHTANDEDSELNQVGGVSLIKGHGAATTGTAVHAPARTAATTDQVLTLVGLAALAFFALLLDLDVGFVSITVATLLALASPTAQKGAVNQISWSTVLLLGGVLTFVTVLQEAGTVTYVGDAVAGIGIPLLVALLLCYIGAIVSAFASSTAILGVTIPLAVPFLLSGDVGAVGVILALSIASTIVDVSPFSTNGALVLASSPEADRDTFYKQILSYSTVVVVVGPLVAWAVVVAPGWL